MRVRQEFLALAKSKFRPDTAKTTAPLARGVVGSTSLPGAHRVTDSGKSFRTTKSNLQPDLLRPTTKPWPSVPCSRPLNTSMLNHPLYEEITPNVQSKHPLVQLDHAFNYIYVYYTTTNEKRQ